MNTLLLSCPHCGFSREVPREKIPPTAKSVVCPTCKGRFSLNNIQDGYGEIVHGNSNVSWKHWEEVAAQRTLEEKQRQGAAANPGIAGLLRDGWRVYREKAVMLAFFYVYALMLGIIPWICFSQINTTSWLSLARLLLILFTGTLSSLGLAVGMSSLFLGVVNDHANIRQNFWHGLRKLPGFLWLSFCLVFLVVGGGLLFIIPGLVFSVLFSLAFFVYYHERESGLDAISISYQYVKHAFKDSFLKISLLLILLALSSILFFIQFVVMPYALVCLFLIYRDVREESGRRSLADRKFKMKFVAPAVAAYLCVFAFVGITALKKNDFGNLAGSIADLRNQAAILLAFGRNATGIAPVKMAGCALALEKQTVRPGERIKVHVAPSSEIQTDYHLVLTEISGNIREVHTLDREAQRQRLFFVTAPNEKGLYKINIYSAFDRTSVLSSIEFRVI